jgi:cAMP-dependent protein kinase regulator
MVLGRKKEPEDPAIYIARKDYDRAVRIYRDRIAKQPDNLNTRLALADALWLAGRDDASIQEFIELANLYTKQGFIIKAVAIYKKILRLRPEMTEIEQQLSDLSTKRKVTPPPPQSQSSDKPGHPEKKSEALPYMGIETVLFQHLSAEEFRELVSHLTLKHYEEGTLIVAEGDPGNSMFVIVNGEVSVNTVDAQGKQIQLANLAEGEFFGEISLLTGKPRTATIITNTGTDLLELTREDYGKIVAAHPHVSDVLNEWHHQRAKKTVEAIIQSWRDSQ